MSISNDFLFSVSTDSSIPKTPVLPSIPDQPRNTYWKLKINTKISGKRTGNTSNPSAKAYPPVRRNIFPEKKPVSENPKKKTRSSSFSAKEKAKYYIHEISFLNQKIQNLIKEQESMKERVFSQEGVIQNFIERETSEIQSATIQERESVEESFFNITFKPQEKWFRSRKFPREVFRQPFKK